MTADMISAALVAFAGGCLAGYLLGHFEGLRCACPKVRR